MMMTMTMMMTTTTAARRSGIVLGIVALLLSSSRADAEEPIIGISAEPRAPTTTTTTGPPPPSRIEAMRQEMHTYFAGESSEGWVFTGTGLASLTAASLGLFVAKDDVYRGAAIPIGAIGVIQLAAGIVLGLRTSDRVADFDAKLNQGRGLAFWEHEAPRMRKVQSQFRVLEIVELGLAIAGVGIATYGGAVKDHFVSGIGVGLAVQSGLMLALDHVAAERAERYANAIATFGP